MIIRNLSNAEYHARPELSKSQLDDLDKSAFVFFMRHRVANRPPRPAPTPAMLLGTMVHAAVLEPELFGNSYAVAPVCDRRTKEGKAIWEDFTSKLKPGQMPVSDAEMGQCMGMYDSVRKVGPIAELLRSGEAEVSAFWKDEDTGVDCRCRPDWIHPVGNNGCVILDIKTTESASPDEFAKSVAKWRYDLQSGFYSDGWEAATGQKVHAFILGTVEKSYPYAAAAYMLDEDAIENGRRTYKRLLRTYAECINTNEWPGYSQEIQLLSLPRWARKEQE